MELFGENQNQEKKISLSAAKRRMRTVVVVVFILWNFVFYLTHGVKSFVINIVDNLCRAATLRDTFEGTWKNISATIKAGQSHLFFFLPPTVAVTFPSY